MKNSINNLILQSIANTWRVEIPQFSCVNIPEVPRITKGANYLCDEYRKKSKKYYFLTVDFTKIQGLFSIGVSISQSARKSIYPLGSLVNGESPGVGSYGIWQFMARPSYTWAILDPSAHFKTLLPGLAIPPFDWTNIWKPGIFSDDIQINIEEAVRDVTRIIKRDVIPRLLL